MAKELTVKDVINTMTPAQKNTLYFHMEMAINGKATLNAPYASINSFDDNQKKVFYYLIGCALEKELDSIEIVKGDD